MFDEIPISIIKLHVGRFQTFHNISLSEVELCVLRDIWSCNEINLPHNLQVF